ncbi:MAG: SAM-dependent methyltransferase [Muribaculaceae bacterium]|nr:SAM-dependent methyltransferase [Muribaculaceae bacterium]
MTDSTTPTGTIYLLPVALSDSGDLRCVLPDINFTIVRGIRFFVVENLRSARRFLKKCDRSIDIDTLTFFTLNEHTNPAEIPEMLAPALAGNDIGVISEAGCPAVADPGADLVAAAQSRGIRVMPLVGPSSILMGLMGSGFNGQSFAFAGYLPVDSAARTATLKEMERRINRERQTQIFIETPYRNNRLVEELCRTLPDSMLLCIASDITGENQNITTLPISKWKKRKYDYSHKPTIFLLYR